MHRPTLDGFLSCGNAEWMHALPEQPAQLPCRVWPADWLLEEDWQRHFPARQPLHVDVGAGKGRFLLERARRHPGINFLGIERQLLRVGKIGKKAHREGLSNVRLLRLDGFYTVQRLFPPESVAVFYVLFPDPWPKRHHWRHRICNPDFIAAAHRTLMPGGLLHFATDHLPYFSEVVDLFRTDPRWTAITPPLPSEAERSDFELMFMAEKPVGRWSVSKQPGQGNTPEATLR
jgi:tRNA (guanine-N7-)-methyltransferase